MLKFEKTPDHFPEPGVGGAEYAVWDGHVRLGKVASEWNRTDGRHWKAYFGSHGQEAVVRDLGGTPRAFETRAAAAEEMRRWGRYGTPEHREAVAQAEAGR